MNQGYINHIVIVIDSSGSMAPLQSQVIKVIDGQISHLAQRSKELDQETRATVYLFNTGSKCVYYDKDVLRVPSIQQHYRPAGGTALIDAAMKAILDLEQTPELYGDHAFLVYVITDGQENSSKIFRSATLEQKLKSLKDNWTVAVMVPDQFGVHEAKKFGFPSGNIQVWNSAGGMAEVERVVRQSTDSFMAARATGVRGTKALFQVDTTNLDKKTVNTTLRRLSAYDLLDVDRAESIAEFVEYKTGIAYRRGSAFYQLTKPEEVQHHKDVCVVDRNSGAVYGGSEARSLLGLPPYDIKIGPSFNNNYDIFIQSTSVNRKLVPGTRLLVVR